MKKFKKLYSVSHRGSSDTSFGIHSRIPMVLQGIDPNSILVLAYIDIDQFKDRVYMTTGFKSAIKIELMASILNLSKDTVKRAVKDLEKRRLIKVLKRKGNANAYISNIIKFKIKYQIFTLTFLARQDISILSKSLIVKLLMLNTERINNIGNINALAKEIEMSRNSIYKVFEELDKMSYVLEIEDGIFALDIESIMLESDRIIVREVGELRSRVKKLTKDIRNSGK